MEKLIVKNFGPIKEAEIDLTKFVVFIGDTSTGKSVLGKLISIFRDFNFVFLSTSEAFLKKSDFARNQYTNIVRIRAIESGRYILKCSFDGTSCLLNPNGDIVKYINNEFQIVSIPEIKENTIFQKILLKL